MELTSLLMSMSTKQTYSQMAEPHTSHHAPEASISKNKQVLNLSSTYQTCCVTHDPQKASALTQACIGDGVFLRTADDEKTALSIEDKIFLDLMKKEVYLTEDNHWVAPLPFHSPRIRLPDNKEQAKQRLFSLQRTFQKKPGMKEHFFEFM